MKYKVGDRVRIKSIDWYNENKDKTGFIRFNYANFIPEMSRYCDDILTINQIVEEYEQYLVSECPFSWTDGMIEGLVERNGKTYPYKIGDRVVLKGNNRCATITDLKYNSWGNLSYYIKIDNDKDISIDYPTDLLLPYDNMIEELVEEEIREVTDKHYWEMLGGENNNEINLPKGYIFKDENGNVINATKIVLVKKKKEYPKTYEECLSVLGIYNGLPDVEIYNAKPSECTLFESLIRLKRCRDAYCKIAGKEMGLDGPWEPDWNDEKQNKYGFYDEVKYTIINPAIFVFPTEEMRDAFKENFKKEIEICKELL